MNVLARKSLRPDLLKEFHESSHQGFQRVPSVFDAQVASAPEQAQFKAHPYWSEWMGLSPAVQAACRNDFRVFLTVREAGMLASLTAQVAKDFERSAVAESRELDRRTFEQELTKVATDPSHEARILERRHAAQTTFQEQIAAANAKSLAALRR